MDAVHTFKRPERGGFPTAEQVCACVEERSAGCVHLQWEEKQTSPGRRTRSPLNVKRREGRRSLKEERRDGGSSSCRGGNVKSCITF